MQQTDLIIILAPSIYDFRELPLLHTPRNLTYAPDSPTNTNIGLLASASQLEKECRSVRIVDAKLACKIYVSTRMQGSI